MAQPLMLLGSRFAQAFVRQNLYQVKAYQLLSAWNITFIGNQGMNSMEILIAFDDFDAVIHSVSILRTIHAQVLCFRITGYHVDRAESHKLCKVMQQVCQQHPGGSRFTIDIY